VAVAAVVRTLTVEAAAVALVLLHMVGPLFQQAAQLGQVAQVALVVTTTAQQAVIHLSR
jgi:hypothetical protein